MSEWKKVRLGDVCSKLGDGLHGTPKYSDNGEYYFINGNNLSNGRIVIKNDTQKVNLTEFEKYKKDLSDRTILVSINGTLGNIAIYKGEKCILGKSACYFNVNNNVNKEFIRYIVTNNDFQEYIRQFANGTTIKNVSLKAMRDYKFSLPPLSEQERIVGILGALDDKIELNNRINRNLEEQAQALFKRWFVENLQVENRKSKIENLGRIICGKTPSKSNREYFGGDIPFVKIPDMHGSTFIIKTEDSLTEIGAKTQINKQLPKYSILVSCIATVGLVSINTEISQCNQQINAIIPLKEYYTFFLFLKLKSMYNQLQLLASGGSATLNLNTGHFSKIEIDIPTEVMLIDFHKVMKPIFNKIESNIKENLTLASLRDSLLPKLMNNEL